MKEEKDKSHSDGWAIVEIVGGFTDHSVFFRRSLFLNMKIEAMMISTTTK